MTKETLRLHGLTKLDQLVSSMMYSPFRAQKRMDEWSNGCPAYWRTAEKAKMTEIRTGTERKKVCLHRINSADSLFLCIPNMMGRSLGCRWRRTGVPIKSWGRYPRRGTALRNTQRVISHSVKPDSLWTFSFRSTAYLSSTSWNTQLGVCVVVKMRLSVGILGALRKREEFNYEV